MTGKYLALVGKVEWGQRDRFTPQVHPDVHLGKIGQRKNAEVLTRVVTTVEEVPQLRTLVLRVPLAEIVAVGKKALLGAGLLFVAPATAEARGEFVLLDRVEQSHRLQRIARSVGAFLLLDPTLVDRILDMADDQPRPEFFGERVPVSDGLGKIMAGIDMEERKRNFRRPEGLGGEVGHNNGILAAGKKQGRILKLRGRLAQDKNRFGLKLAEMV